LKYSETYSQKGSWLLQNQLIFVISPFLLTGFFLWLKLIDINIYWNTS
jgi:hypothetical protein